MPPFRTPGDCVDLQNARHICGETRRRTLLRNQERVPEILHRAVVVLEPEHELTHVLTDGSPVHFINLGFVEDRFGEHAQHGLPLIPPQRVPNKH